MPIFSLPDLAIRSHSRIRQSMPFQSMCIMHGVAWRTISRKVSKSGRSGHGYRAADLTSSLPFEPRNRKISSMIGTQNFAKVLLALTHRRYSISTKSPNAPGGSLCEIGFLKLYSPRIPARYFRASLTLL